MLQTRCKNLSDGLKLRGLCSVHRFTSHSVNEGFILTGLLTVYFMWFE